MSLFGWPLCRDPLDIRRRYRRNPPVILETGDLLLELRDSSCLLLELRDSSCLLAKRFEFRDADGNDLHKRFHLNILFMILSTHNTSNEDSPDCLSFPMIFYGAPSLRAVELQAFT